MKLFTQALLLAASVSALAVSSYGCSQAKDAPEGSTSSASTLPCDVGEVLQKNCQSCHADKPQFGAPMPLVTHDHTQVAAKSDPSKKVWELIAKRIHDPLRPMPPSGNLAAADMKKLDDWAAASAPAGGAKCADAPAVEAKNVGPKFLPCPESEQVTFRAHAEAPEVGFHVPEDAGNLNMCFSWKAPWTSDTQATSFAPIIDDARVVHHWILFETSVKQPEGVGRKCQMPADATFLQGWAPGGENRVMPSDIGLALPNGEKWLILQVHYWNAARLTDANDRSGVSMCTTKDGNLRPKTAVISTLGSLNISLPARSTNTVVTGKCTPALTEPAHIIGAGPHMHTLGRTFKTEILRGGKEASPEVLVNVPRWDFESQTNYETDTVINPGDVLRTTCTYDNPSDNRVFFGEKTENEMCFDFVAVWPAPGLVTAGGRASKRCIDL